MATESKHSTLARKRRQRRRLHEAGLAEVTVPVPVARKPEIRALAARLRADPARPASVSLGRLVQAIRSHRRALEAAGIRHLAVYGSLARGEARPDSDIDLLADLDREIVPDLFALIGLQDRVRALLAPHVGAADIDLVARAGLPPERLAAAEAEAVLAY